MINPNFNMKDYRVLITTFSDHNILEKQKICSNGAKIPEVFVSTLE